MIAITSFVSGLTFFLVLHYLDPYEYTLLAVSIITICFILCISTWLSLFIYFFKKIYYRGEVYLFHVINSFRQGFFISLFLLWVITFIIIWAPILLTSSALAMLLVFLELFIQDLLQ